MLYKLGEFSTADFVLPERVDAWASTVHPYSIDLHIDSQNIAGWRSEYREMVGPHGAFLACSHTRGSESIFTPHRSEQDVIVVSLNQQGSCEQTIRNSRSRQLFSQGELVAYDTALGAHYRWTAGRQINLALNRDSALTALGGAIDTYLPLNGHALAPLLCTQMAFFDQQAAYLNPQETALVLDGMHQLAFLILTGIGIGMGHRTALAEDTLYASATLYIKKNYADHRLTPEKIAAQLRCSRATLYRAFANRNMAMADFVRETRLMAAREMLEPFNIGNIESIAYACGFSSPSVFGKLFKARFLMAPKEWRALFADRTQLTRAMHP